MRNVNAAHNNEYRFRQQENAALTYTVNWAGQLDSDTISTSTWSSEDSGVTISGESNTTTEASARVTGANPGTYRVVNKIVTAGGDTDERVIIVRVDDNDNQVNGSDYWYN